MPLIRFYNVLFLDVQLCGPCSPTGTGTFSHTTRAAKIKDQRSTHNCALSNKIHATWPCAYTSLMTDTAERRSHPVRCGRLPRAYVRPHAYNCHADAVRLLNTAEWIPSDTSHKVLGGGRSSLAASRSSQYNGRSRSNQSRADDAAARCNLQVVRVMAT